MIQSIANLGIVPAALASISLLAVDAATFFVDAMAPPPVEGTGVYLEPVSPGDTVLVQWTITKRTDCNGENWRVWDGALGFHITEVRTPTGLPSSSEARDYAIPTTIPRGAPPGDLYLRIEGYYQCPGQPKKHFALGPVRMTVAP